MTVYRSCGKIRKGNVSYMGGAEMQFNFMIGGFAVLFSWAVGLLVVYLVIYLAVKHAINNAQSLRELRDEIRALRFSVPPRDPTSGSPYGPGPGGPGNWK